MNPLDLLAQPFTLPCGVVLPNRLCKTAMTEGLGDAQLRATPEHVRLCAAWGCGGVGLNITGNVMVDRFVIERPGNVAGRTGSGSLFARGTRMARETRRQRHRTR
jgi:2,4-dienoyl-CoA reductase-like NADH-dependent reductase (Old Yellow Enzyme family)